MGDVVRSCGETTFAAGAADGVGDGASTLGVDCGLDGTLTKSGSKYGLN